MASGSRSRLQNHLPQSAKLGLGVKAANPEVGITALVQSSCDWPIMPNLKMASAADLRTVPENGRVTVSSHRGEFAALNTESKDNFQMTRPDKIGADKFYASFARLFNARLQQQPEYLVDVFTDSERWTTFMLDELLPQVIKHVAGECLEIRREFQHIDLCAWNDSGEEWDQGRYRMPLYVHLAIEHENGLHPQQEFWKFLYLYAPLKILVCYCYSPQHGKWPQLDQFLTWLEQMHDRACGFHPRSTADAYLVIIGERDVATPAELAWQGYQIEAGQQGFSRL